MKGILAALAGIAASLIALPCMAERPLVPWERYQAGLELRRGTAALLRGALPRADASSLRMLRLAPEDAGSWRLRCAVLAASKRWAEAEPAADKLNELAPGDVDAALVAGRVAVELSHPEEARLSYRRASGIDASDPRGPVGLALVAARLDHDFQAMAAALGEARSRQPGLDLSALPLDEAWAPVADSGAFLSALEVVLRAQVAAAPP